MKTLAIASLVMLFAAPAMAGEAAVPALTLQGMGLSKMQQMSDDDGLAVRGKGPFDNQFFWNGGAHGPTLNNSFIGRFGWQGLGGSFGDPAPDPGGNPVPGPGGNPNPGMGGFGGNFSFDLFNN
jgi:hypothetical protein